jgi:hypothetical protein
VERRPGGWGDPLFVNPWRKILVPIPNANGHSHFHLCYPLYPHSPASYKRTPVPEPSGPLFVSFRFTFNRLLTLSLLNPTLCWWVPPVPSFTTQGNSTMDKLKAGWAKLTAKWTALDKKARKRVVIACVVVGFVALVVLTGGE